MIDCLLIGHNDLDFREYETMLRKMGTRSGAYRDIALNFVEYEKEPYRAMDLINHFHFEGKEKPARPLNNGDFISPAILYLGTFLDKHGYSFDYVNFFNFEKEKLEQKLATEDILTVGITTTLYVSVKPIMEIIALIRKWNKTAKIIIGGPFIATQMRQADAATMQYLFKSIGADFYIHSIEGEQALVNILSKLKRNETNYEAIPNIWFKQQDRYIETILCEENNRLEENPIRWELFNPTEIGEFVSLRTSKSCPFACSFCGFPERAGQYQYVCVDDIENEVNQLREKTHVSTIYFIDDTFNVPKERFKEILRMMIKNQYEFKWHLNYRCQFADEETVSLMKAAGCEGVFLGIESGSNEVLKVMNKNATVEQYREGLRLLNQYGITSYASIIIGFPGETEDTVQETIRFIEEARPTFFRTLLWYCDPLTPIWREKEKYQLKGSMFQWSHGTMDANRACEHIEQIFLSVQNSIWLPQNGFEIFSLFYLQRKGMQFEQIREFIQHFNEIIKNRLRNTPELDGTLFQRIRELCMSF